MAGRKNSPKHGMLKGKKPTGSKDFVKGEQRTYDAAHKGGQARKAQFARYKSLREAAMALRDLPSQGDANLSNGVAAVAAMYLGAQCGDPKAFHELTALMGELVEKVDVQNLPIIRDDIPRAPGPAPATAPTAEGGAE